MRFGVDEAGKGPVLGSMFAAAVHCDPAALPDGVGDSKGIAPARREELAARIREVATVGVAEIHVDRIDDPETDMNTLTVDAHAEALAKIVADGRDDAPYTGMVDAGDADAARFGERVGERVDADLQITAEHQADESDPVVGAASIVAKVERDAHVERLAGEYGEVGSGYPSDPTTRTFLREFVDEHGSIPSCARTSWATCDDALAAAEQSGLNEF